MNRTAMGGKPVFVVPMNTHINFKSLFGKKKLCGTGGNEGPTFTAGQACAYSCAYCYVPSMQNKLQEHFKAHGVEYGEDGHLGVVIRNQDAIEGVRRQLSTGRPEFRRHNVIYASPKVDVAGNLELVRETVEICKLILDLTNWDIRLLSKSNLLPKIAQAIEAAYPEVPNPMFTGSKINWAKQRLIFGVSTGTLNDRLASFFEDGTARVSKRLESLHWLQDNGYRTFGMICPSLPMADAAAYAQFATDMCAAIRADRCEHVWAEPINVRGDSFERTIAALEVGGYLEDATRVHAVSTSPAEWERYARDTFLAHAPLYPAGKLRFLQYVNKRNQSWWIDQQERGAILL